jgi:hypothetical protein
LKINYFYIATGAVAIASILLPWFNIELWTKNLSSTMNFSAYLYQLSGNVEGVTKTIFLFVWFNATALVLMTATALTCFFVSAKPTRKRALMVLPFALALISITVFAYGLVSSNFAVESLNPGYTISQFPQGAFAISAEQSMQNSYDYSWNAGYGFWLAIATAIVTMVFPLLSRKQNTSYRNEIHLAGQKQTHIFNV